jgi:hypothetical protein
MKSGIVGLFIVAALGLASPAYAERPITKDKYVHDCNIGYILVWAGPLNGKTKYLDYLDFVRLDPNTGMTMVADSAYIRSTNARRVKDAAAIYYEAKPWVIQNDRGLFLIPVNPGRWAIGAAGVTAFALGSYGFDVAPCKVTYLGTVLTGLEDGKSDIPEIKAAGDALKGIVENEKDIPSTFAMRPPDLSELPSDFPRENLVIATMIPDVRFNNYISGLVGRASGLGPMGHEPPVVRKSSNTKDPASATTP